MSAYICNPEHLGLLAALSATHDGTPDQACDRAELFARENIASVAFRYPADASGKRPGPCLHDDDIVEVSRLWAEHYSAHPPAVHPSFVAGYCKCLDYQSCEHDEWESSEAKRLLDNLWRSLPTASSRAWDYRSPSEPESVAQWWIREEYKG